MSYKRSDIKDDDILNAWSEGLSGCAIAKKFSCSYDTVARRLKKHGIELTRREGASRNYKIRHDVLWSQIQVDLDNGCSVNFLSKKYNIASKTLKKLIAEYNYNYDIHKVKKDILLSDKYKQQLISLRKNHTVKEIAQIVGKSEQTVGRHLKAFGLTMPTNRTDINDEDILFEWNQGYSIAEIARKYQCSHDTITKRLKKYNIVCDKSIGIERHFDKIHDDDWLLIKADLDKCIPISVVATRHNIRYEAVYRMMERNGYQYYGLQDLDENMLSKRIDNCVDAEELKYLQAISDYYKQYGNLPVIYTLSRFMNCNIDSVKNAIVKYSLCDFIGNNGPSVKVLRIIHDLDILGIRYEQNNRKILRSDDGSFMEMDIYLPDFKLGIEVNPTWTHSVDTGVYGQSDRYYHQKKSLLAANAGVGLLHMYDSDFTNESKYQVFLAQIKALIGSKIKIGARQCCVKIIDRTACNQFLKQYHFQGAEKSSFIQYGLFYHDILVGVLSVGKSRYTADDYEILRYCMHPSYIVHGCFQKLFQTLLRHIGHSCRIVSYMDLNKRMTSSNVYEKNGFLFDGITTPDYVWYNQSGTKMKSRYSVQKKQLIKQGFDASKSETDIMREQGYCRVFGAGSKRYIYQYERCDSNK